MGGSELKPPSAPLVFEKLTRQGVRDLNGPIKNRRVVPFQRVCFHDWEILSNGLGWMGDGHEVSWERCRRCRAER